MNILLYLSLFCLIVINELVRKKRTYFDALFFVNVWFALSYAIIPIFLILYPDTASVGTRIYPMFENLAITPWLAYLGYGALIAGWHIAGERVYLVPSRVLGIVWSRERIILIVGLLVSLLSFWLYAQSYGGIMSALQFGSALRYSRGVKEEIDIGRTVVFMRLVVLSTYIGYYVFVRLLLHAQPRRFYQAILFCAFCIRMMMMPITSGRGAVIFYIAGYYIIYTIVTKKYHVVRLAMISIGTLLFIGYGKQLFGALPLLINGDVAGFIDEFSQRSSSRLAEGFSITGILMQEGGHVIISLEQAVLQAGRSYHDYSYFREYIDIIFHVVPRRLIGIMFTAPVTLSEINTEMLTGSEYGGIPPGVIASFMYCASYTGIVIGMTVYGFITRIINNMAFVWSCQYPPSLAFSIPVMMAHGAYLINGDPKVSAISNFILYFTIAILMHIALKSEARGLRHHPLARMNQTITRTGRRMRPLRG